MQGLVKFFNAERGYGFVHNEAGSWWFHRSYCRGDLPVAGDTVEFWLDDGTRGDFGSRRRDCCAHRFHCLIPTAYPRVGELGPAGAEQNLRSARRLSKLARSRSP